MLSPDLLRRPMVRPENRPAKRLRNIFLQMHHSGVLVSQNVRIAREYWEEMVQDKESDEHFEFDDLENIVTRINYTTPRTIYPTGPWRDMRFVLHCDKSDLTRTRQGAIQTILGIRLSKLFFSHGKTGI